MTTNVNDSQTADPAEPRSNLACHRCRRRKVKCGRELPSCLPCQETGQKCEYPAKAQRPGPKVGVPRGVGKRHAQRSHDENLILPDATRQRISAPDAEMKSGISLSEDFGSAQPSIEPKETPWDTRTMQVLAFLVHPSHDSRSPEDHLSQSPGGVSQASSHDYLVDSCFALGVTRRSMDQIISRFFEEFHTFSLFRECDFSRTLQKCATPLQHRALLACISISATKNDIRSEEKDADFAHRQGPLDFADIGLKYVEAAIQECGEELIPLVLLQTVILLTHWLLTRGVRGRAWRFLGIATRAAYELNLHLIDTERASPRPISPQQWIEDEEQRRAWWAIWEMDVFASVIRRCPTGIDWSQNETFLPVKDELWALGEPQPSGYLKLNLNQRWKTLEACKSTSPKAWFIVITSLMKDAQTITSPSSIEKRLSDFQTDARQSSMARLDTIRNALHCAVMALPQELRYRGGRLSFGARETDRPRALAQRQNETSIYSIHFVTQLTRIMIAKGYFIDACRGSQSTQDAVEARKPSPKEVGMSLSSHEALDLALEASDEVLRIVRRSSEDQFRYVSPFLACTTWFSGVIQMIHRRLRASDPTEKALIDSKFDVLRLSHQHLASYWNLPVALKENLQLIESELHCLTVSMNTQASIKASALLDAQSLRRDWRAIGPDTELTEPNNTAQYRTSGAMPGAMAIPDMVQYDRQERIRQLQDSGIDDGLTSDFQPDCIGNLGTGVPQGRNDDSIMYGLRHHNGMEDQDLNLSATQARPESSLHDHISVQGHLGGGTQLVGSEDPHSLPPFSLEALEALDGMWFSTTYGDQPFALPSFLGSPRSPRPSFFLDSMTDNRSHVNPRLGVPRGAPDVQHDTRGI